MLTHDPRLTVRANLFSAPGFGDGSALAAVAATAAVSFHLLTTVTVMGVPIRIGASDLFVGPLLCWAALWWTRERYVIPRLRIPGIWGWLGGLTGCVMISLVVGRLHTGEWSSWGLVNKAAGWLVLMGYGALGLWLTMAGNDTARRVFLRVFLAAGWLGAAASLLLFVSTHLGLFKGMEGGYYRLRGAFENPNAFGFVLVIILFLQLAFTGPHRLFRRGLNLFGLSLLVLGIFFAGSRSAWLGAAAGVVPLLLLRAVNLREVVGALIGAVAIERLLLFVIPSIVAWLPDAVVSDLTPEAPIWDAAYQYVFRESLIVDSGLEHRLRISQQAFALWQESPIFGIGLGSFFWEQLRNGQIPPAAIHTTILWLLTEMGLVGALAFGAFFVWVFAGAWSEARRTRDPIMVALVAIVVATAAASIGLEILYQRYLWFILGLALPVCSNRATG